MCIRDSPGGAEKEVAEFLHPFRPQALRRDGADALAACYPPYGRFVGERGEDVPSRRSAGLPALGGDMVHQMCIRDRAPTVHGNLIVGPNAEPVGGGDTATTSQGLAYVREKALRSIPSICFQEDIRSFAGVRAVAEGGDFLIREAEGAPGFFDLAGICSPGLTAAPAVAEYAVELLGCLLYTSRCV